ncbi:MAG: hypothetical protein ACM3O8_00535 [Methylococcaceae bacterium]|nr:hypothetical protein [Prolixibacteraceae bacterium]
MKKKIFEYLKNHYDINVNQLLISGIKNGSLGMIDSKDLNGEILPLVYTTQKDENETDLYLFYIGEDALPYKIQRFISDLKSFIQTNSNKKIVKSSYDKDWYYWEDSTMKISFGIKSEKTGFSMRMSFPNESKCNSPMAQIIN